MIGDTLAVIAGAKGFIGSNLARDLVQRGRPVVLADLQTVSDFRIKDLLAHRSVSTIPLAATEADSVRSFVRKIEEFVRAQQIQRLHLYWPLAYFSYDPRAPFDRYHQINVESTEKIIRAVAESSIAKIACVMVWSSATVHGGAENCDAWINRLGGVKMSKEVEDLLRPHLYFDETSLCLPSSRYELSKYLQELVALAAGNKYVIDVRVGRPSGVYGPWSTYATASAIFKIAGGELKGIPGPGTAQVSLAHVDDVVGAFEYIADHGQAGEVYEIADDCKYTVGELFTHVAQEIGLWRKKRGEPPLQFDPNFHLPIPLVLANAWWLKLTSRFTGLQPRLESDLVELFFRPARFSHEKLTRIGYQFKEPDTCRGISRTIDWYAENGWI